MSFPESATRPGGDTKSAGLHVPTDGGLTKWFNGDILTIKLTAEQSTGALSLIEATVPPGGGPAPHIHPHTDETFYMVDGQLEFLQGERVITISAGDLVFLPRGTTHRYTNIGIQPARMIILYTPGGAEGLFAAGGDEPVPGRQVQPWGPERLDEQLLSLLTKYDCALPPA